MTPYLPALSQVCGIDACIKPLYSMSIACCVTLLYAALACISIAIRRPAFPHVPAVSPQNNFFLSGCFIEVLVYPS